MNDMDNVSNFQETIGFVADASACGTACNSHPTCEFWVYYTSSYPVPSFVGQCIARWSLGFTYPVPGTTYGLKGCV